MTRVLVVGGAGFIGVPTVRRLLGGGHDVAVLDDFSTAGPERLDALRSPRLQVVRGDIREVDTVLDAVRSTDPQAIIHLAAVHFIPYCDAHPATTISINVTGLQHVLDAAARAGVERLVFTSTGDVYTPSERPHREDDPTEPTGIYGASKLMGEWLIRFWRKRGGPPRPVVARLFNVAGPNETTAHVLSDICWHLKAGDVLPLGNRTSRRDYVYVEDVASVLVDLLDVPASDVTINVGTGLSWSVDDLVARMARLTGRELVIDTDPAKVRKTDRPILQPDITALRELLPQFAPTELNTVLREILAAKGLLPGQ